MVWRFYFNGIKNAVRGGPDGGFAKERWRLDYFLRTTPPREEEARGADVLAADERVPDEWTAVGRADERGVDERVGEDMRGE